MPVIFHTISLLICICVQKLDSPLAGAWLFFHLAGCSVLIYNNSYPVKKGVMWYLCLCWLAVLGISGMALAPVAGGATTMFILASAPSLALCLRKEHLNKYIWSFGSVSLIYALGLILQMFLHVKYTHYSTGDRLAWPLLDPNNGAAIINMALIPCVWLGLFRDLRWFLLCPLFGLAMIITGSKAGVLSLFVTTYIMLLYKYGVRFFWFSLAIGTLFAVVIFYDNPDLIVMMVNSFRDRFPIWQGTVPLLWPRWWGGHGLGTFGFYYQRIRIEHYTGGWFAHNDILQMAVEMGIPEAFIFVLLLISAAFTTCKTNMVSGLVILATVLQSMVEFQLYVPSISMILGLAFGYHMINKRPPPLCVLTGKPKKVIMR